MIVAITTVIFATSFMSGVLGMGGGMILLGVLNLCLPIAAVMILHGVTQAFSNGFRFALHFKSIQWRLLPPYFIGSLMAYTVLSFVFWIPSKASVFICLGIFPLIALIIPKKLSLDITKKANSFLCGGLITSLQLMVGASGPTLDIFYVDSPLNRVEVIATKAFTQSFGHILKLVFYIPLFFRSTEPANQTFLQVMIPLAIVATLFATKLSKVVLYRLNDLQFRNYSRIVISMIAAFYFFKGISLTL